MIEGPDQEALLKFASAVHADERTEPVPPGTRERRPEPPSMSHVQPSVANADNWCGQAAVWSLVKFWGLQGGRSDQQLIDDIYTSFPPDFLQPFVNAGTTPFRIAEALRAFGLTNTHVTNVPLWHPGGFLNPLNQPIWHAYRGYIEDKWINAGYPAITLMDSGMLGGAGYNLHWVVASNVGGTVRVHNMLGGGYHTDDMNVDRFHEAWEVRFIPVTQVHFMTVLARP